MHSPKIDTFIILAILENFQTIEWDDDTRIFLAREAKRISCEILQRESKDATMEQENEDDKPF